MVLELRGRSARALSLRRVRPLKRPAVSRMICRSFETASVRVLQTKVVPRKFQLPSLCSVRLAGAGAFLVLPFKACAELCRAAAVHLLYSLKN